MTELLGPAPRAALFAAAAMVLLFLVLPVIVVVPMSFSGTPYLDFPPPVWSIRWYQGLFTSATWLEAFATSLQLALATVALSGVMGVMAAYAIDRSALRLLRYLRSVILLPLVIPHMVIAIGIFYIYVRLDWLGSFAGLLLAHTMLALPFVVVTTLAGLRGFDATQELVAWSLGCTRLGAFLRVTLPQIKGSVGSGLLFAFVTSMDEVIVSMFISAGDNTTLTKRMFSSLRDELDPTIAAISSLLVVLSLSIALSGTLAVSVRERMNK